MASKKRLRRKFIDVPIYGIGNIITRTVRYDVIPPSRLPDDLEYQGIGGDDFLGAFTIYYSPKTGKSYTELASTGEFIKVVVG